MTWLWRWLETWASPPRGDWFAVSYGIDEDPE